MELAQADVVLAFRRKTCDAPNLKIRAELGFNLPYPMAGEKVLCLKNAHRYGVFNGAVYTLARPFERDGDTMCLDVGGDEIQVPDAAATSPVALHRDYARREDHRNSAVKQKGAAGIPPVPPNWKVITAMPGHRSELTTKS